MITLQYDHQVSNGEGGYGAIVVNHGNATRYLGHNFAKRILVEQYPTINLSYTQAEMIVAILSSRPSYNTKVEFNS